MNPSKSLFQRDKELAQWWAAVAHDERFAKVLIYARSEFLDTNMDGARLTGAKNFEQVLLSLSDSENETPFRYPDPQLHHDIDDPRTETVTSKVTKKK